MKILGISAYYHDSAACLVVDGEIVAAAQEERFTRRKHDPRFPRNAVDYCLEEAGIGPEELDLVAFYDKPLLKFDRILETPRTRTGRRCSRRPIDSSEAGARSHDRVAKKSLRRAFVPGTWSESWLRKPVSRSRASTERGEKTNGCLVSARRARAHHLCRRFV